jgi:hypothetical protein
MKAVICFTFAAIALTSTAFAAPTLLVEAKITEHQADGGSVVLAAPHLTVTDGTQAIVGVGKVEYSITPKLLDDGNVLLQIVILKLNDRQGEPLAAPRIVSQLGKTATFRVGQLEMSLNATLAK